MADTNSIDPFGAGLNLFGVNSADQAKLRDRQRRSRSVFDPNGTGGMIADIPHKYVNDFMAGKFKPHNQANFKFEHYQQDLDNMKQYGGKRIEDLSPAERQAFANQVGGGADTGGSRDIFRMLSDEAPKHRLSNLRNQITGEAQDFRKNLGSMADEQYGLLKEQTQEGLDQGLKQTRRNYNSRGLLYSGMRQGAEGSLRGEAASGLAQGRASINKGLEDAAFAKEAQAAAVGLENYKEMQARAEELYSAQVGATVAKLRAAQSLGQGLGQAGGYYYGSQSPTGKASGTYSSPGLLQDRTEFLGANNYGGSYLGSA